MSMPQPTAVPQPQRWFHGVPRYAWIVLAVCALGWLFDTMDQHLFNLVAQKSIRTLLAGRVPEAAMQAAVNSWRGAITAVFLVGWAVGGFIFGMMGDRIGRTRTLVLTISIYAAFTGLCGLVQTPLQYMACRFLTALGIGGEFAAGVALVAEVFPQRSRPMALGLLQALSAVGNMSAALIVLFLRDDHWRTVFYVGALPALLVLWIRRSVREPEGWSEARERAAASGVRNEMGSLREMFGDPVLRRNTIAGVLLALAGVGGMWGVGFWLKDLLDIAFEPLKLTAAQRSDYGAYAFLLQNMGAFLGMFGYAALSERIGRKPSMAIVFVLAFLAVQGTFWCVNSPLSAMVWAPVMGTFALAPFSAYCVYFPELYPTRLRATGVGFCYNCARVLAALAPFTLGNLSGAFAREYGKMLGFRMACSAVACVYVFGFVGLLLAPETRGKPLPE